MAYYHKNLSNTDNSDDNDNNNMSNPSLRFMYDMDDDILASPTNSLHDSGTTCATFGVLSPIHDYDPPPGHPERRHEKRNSFRQTLTQAFTSPIRAASTKGKISLISPRKTSSKNSSTSTKGSSGGGGGGDKKWRKQLHLPKHVKQDEAIAMLLATELKMLDF